jgi:hypothetical protein
MNLRVAINEESVERFRPPRCIYQDRIIRPYKQKEAQIVFILKVIFKIFKIKKFMNF